MGHMRREKQILKYLLRSAFLYVINVKTLLLVKCVISNNLQKHKQKSATSLPKETSEKEE